MVCNPNDSRREDIECAFGRRHGQPAVARWTTLAGQALCHMRIGVMLLAASAWLPSAAQETWIGTRTIGEVRREQAVNAIMAVREAVQSKTQFSKDIAAARKAFFDTATRPGERPAVEKRFADMLKAKDFYYAQQMVTEGTSEYSQKRVAGLDALTGGALDGGIPEAGRAAFHDWVDALRTSLGARDRKQMLVVGDATQVRKALANNMGLYEAYARLRDKHEFDVRAADATSSTERAAAIAANRIAVQNLTPEGRERLHKQSEGFFDTGTDARLALAPRPVADSLTQLMRSGQRVLRCTYGPTGASQDGSSMVYETHVFWHKQAPADIGAIIAADRRKALGNLRTANAVPGCPETRTLASAALSAIDAPGAAAAPASPVAPVAAVARAAPRDIRSQNRVANTQRRCGQLAEEVRRNKEEASKAPAHQVRYRASRVAASEKKLAQNCNG